MGIAPRGASQKTRSAPGYSMRRLRRPKPVLSYPPNICLRLCRAASWRLSFSARRMLSRLKLEPHRGVKVEIIPTKKIYPVIVIGSGAAGGLAAWNLTQKGIPVLLLDAGEKFNREEFWTHVQPWEWHQRFARAERPPQFFLDTKEHPSLTPPD